ncbi:hypothetical protein [Bifidobacterium longum]|uniref:hypothetical protein n=1 Tax=Bifidobacterium longum TaxID=216816 RepID=UPI00103D167B|nr:hypothetical protein [Bifidobacterium longum]
MKFVQLRELLLQRCHTGVGGFGTRNAFAGDGHRQGDGEEDAHAFENVGVAVGHGAGDVDAQGDGRSNHKHDKHRVSGRLPVGRGHMFLSRLVDTTH